MEPCHLVMRETRVHARAVTSTRHYAAGELADVQLQRACSLQQPAAAASRPAASRSNSQDLCHPLLLTLATTTLSTSSRKDSTFTSKNACSSPLNLITPTIIQQFLLGNTETSCILIVNGRMIPRKGGFAGTAVQCVETANVQATSRLTGRLRSF